MARAHFRARVIQTRTNEREIRKMGFNPNQHKPTSGQGNDEEIPAGVYLLSVGPWLKCPTERSWKSRFGVLSGPSTGASIFVLQGRDTTKQGTQNRLFYYCKSAAITAELETTSSGLLTERGIRDDILGHVIKAKVSKSRDGQYVNYDFRAFQARDEWSDEERKIAKEWEAKYRDSEQEDGGYSRPADSGGGGDWGTGGGDSGGGFDESAPMPGADGGDGFGDSSGGW